ncbi:MAG: ATPase [Rhodospirillaceae bacterium]|nr:ATPase [Rhodospirillaceae bacterium]MYB13101.1 ATPase [Rhodospirillaceae bacterium]MYI49322.1 ATPase [Rhodospirillaceae bacterium]
MNDLPTDPPSPKPDAATPARPYPNAARPGGAGGNAGRIVVLGNEKGGTGKSTAAMHLIVALLRDGRSVASIDLDGHQGTLTRYVENRRSFTESEGLRLHMPDHRRIGGDDAGRGAADPAALQPDTDALIDRLAATHDYVVLDCPGTDNALARHAISRADILITPINDSFIDLDLLARVGGMPPRVLGPSVYSQTVWEGRQRRAMGGGRPIDWIVLRNRLSPLDSRNKKRVGATLEELAGRIGFRWLDGFHERVIFRQLFLQGLTVLDLREDGAGVPLNMSHVAARQEIRRLTDAVLGRQAGDDAGAHAGTGASEGAAPALAGL